MTDVNTNAKSRDVLFDWEENWRTDLGAWFPGERVVCRGRDLLNDLANLPFLGMIGYGITGREFTPNEISMLEYFWSIGGSFPEPRLWNNRIASITASARSSSALGVGAAVAVSEAVIYGLRPIVATMDFISNCSQRIKGGEDLKSLLQAALDAPVEGQSAAGKNRHVAKVPGFGRPITPNDERIAAILPHVERLGFADGEHLKLAHKIETTLQEMGHNWRMNGSVYSGAIAVDMGLTPFEYYHFMILCFCGGMVPCAVDALQKPEGAFFPLRCNNIHYVGAAPRQWAAG